MTDDDRARLLAEARDKISKGWARLGNPSITPERAATAILNALSGGAVDIVDAPFAVAVACLSRSYAVQRATWARQVWVKSRYVVGTTGPEKSWVLVDRRDGPEPAGVRLWVPRVDDVLAIDWRVVPKAGVL